MTAALRSYSKSGSTILPTRVKVARFTLMIRPGLGVEPVPK
jgi:hypothetical protein